MNDGLVMDNKKREETDSIEQTATTTPTNENDPNNLLYITEGSGSARFLQSVSWNFEIVGFETETSEL